MVYLALAVIFLHIISRPIRVDARASYDSEKGRGEIIVRALFICVFKKEISEGDINKQAAAPASEKSADDKERGALKAYLIRAARAFLSRIRVRFMGLSAVFGLGDAAASAFTAGSVGAIFDAITAAVGCESELSSTADYDNECIFVDFSGTINFSLADVFIAAVAAIPFGGKKERKRIAYYGNGIAE